MALNPVNEIGSNTFGFVLARILNDHSSALQQSLIRLTTGLKSITDDPAGMSSVIRSESEITRLGAAKTVLGNAGSYNTSQTDFLSDVSTSLSRMSELAISSQSASTSDAQRSANQAEFEELQGFISGVGSRTFNGLNLFGTSDLEIVQDGDGSKFNLKAIDYTRIEFDSGISGVDISTIGSAASAEFAVTTAQATLTALQGIATAGAGRINNVTSTITIQEENLQAVVDRIKNVDITTENEEFSNLSLLTQTGTTLIAQYNLLRSNLLTLFQ